MEWDFIVIGSGFGGSVCGLRLVEKGYRVLMLEQGRRFAPPDFPRTNWNLKRWLWMPALGCRGIFRMTFFRHLTALTGVGVGGGSLVYANTLPTPRDEFFSSGPWSRLASWKQELEPHYQEARRMLGTTTVPFRTRSDDVLQQVGEEIGRTEFEPTEVAVFFGEPGVTVPDPYFSGKGPDRTGCTRCGGCMTGCRENAKNTLDRNYLWLAENRGLDIRADSEVTWVSPLDEGGFEVQVREGTSMLPLLRRHRRYRSRRVVFAAGALGTVNLLLRLRSSPHGLPRLSDQVGRFVRTNSEVLMGVTSLRSEPDLSEGIAIGSILHTDDHSHLEPVRYGAGSGVFRLLGAPHAPGRGALRRVAGALLRTIRQPIRILRAWTVPDWARRTMILLYMRTLEGHLTMTLGRSPLRLFRRGVVTRPGAGPLPEAAIPEATELGERIARHLDGVTTSLITETIAGIPTTAHLLGGCTMGESRQDGVIDHRHRVFGYDGLWIVDGSAVSANPGVNPSLTITALAERAMSFVPPRERPASEPGE